MTIGGSVQRTIGCLTLIALGFAAVARMKVELLPSRSFPEATLSLNLPQPQDVEVLTADVLLDLEAAIRATGQVIAVRAWVSVTGAQYQVRFAPGVDPRIKVARLESEVARLRRRLPEGSSLSLFAGSAGGERRSLALWLAGSWTRAEILVFRDQLLRLASVRGVSLAGEPVSTLEVEPFVPELTASEVEARIRSGLSGGLLGSWSRNGTRHEVLAEAELAQIAIEDLLLVGGQETPLQLRSVASTRWRDEPAEWRARLDGAEGRALLVKPADEVSALRLREDVFDQVERSGLEGRVVALSMEAEALTSLVRSVLGGLAVFWVACSLCSVALRSSLLGWALLAPTAASVVLNVWNLAGFVLDTTTLPSLALGSMTAVVVFVLRHVDRRPTGYIAAVVVSSGALLFALRLAGRDLAPLLETPGVALAATACTAAVAALLPPISASPAARRSRVLRYSLSNGWSLALAALASSYVLLALFGRGLAPRAGDLAPAREDLAIEVVFGEGGTTETSGDILLAVEEQLAGDARVAGVWSRWTKSRGAVFVRVVEAERSRTRLRRFAEQLRFQLATLPAAVSVSALRRERDKLQFGHEVGAQAVTDESAALYRFVLRSSNLHSLREMEQEVRERLARHDIRFGELTSDWGPSIQRLELQPSPSTPRVEISKSIEVLRSRLRYPEPASWPGHSAVALQVRDASAPRAARLVPTRRDLEEMAVGRGAAAVGLEFRIGEAAVPPQVLRENGRYVLPLDLRMRWNPPQRARTRLAVDRTLAGLELETEVELQRPQLIQPIIRSEQLRLFLVMLAFPGFMLVLAMIWLNSLSQGMVATVPGVVAVAAAAPWLSRAPSGADELSLLSLAGVLCLGLPLGWHLASRVAPRVRTFGREALYRELAGWVMPLLAAAVCASVSLFAATWDLQAARFAWVTPLRVAAVTGLAMTTAQLTLLPVLVAALATRSRLRNEAEKLRARPPAWLRETGPPALTVRNLTKFYPPRLGERRFRGVSRDPRVDPDGFRALSQVSFTLDAGIVGLLGPNGSGKTTLLRLLCGLLEPTRGQIRYRGVRVEASNLSLYRRGVGFLPQGFNAFESLTAESFLDYWALERGLSDPEGRRREIEKVLALVGLETAARKRVRDLSGGMRRRIGIARALLGDPTILIVDEPTTGLDIESRNQLRQTLLRVAEERVIVFSTHLASDIAAGARQVLVLHGGFLRFGGTVTDFVETGRGAVASAVVSDEQLARLGRQYRIATRVRTAEGVLVRLILGPGQELPDGARPVEPNLEESYLALMTQLGSKQGDSSNHYGTLLDLDSV